MTKFVKVKSGSYEIEVIHNNVDNPSAVILCMHGFNGDRWGDGYIKLKSLDDVFIVSYDSAGHGNSEVPSLDMRMELVNQETIDVIMYIEKLHPNVPIIIFSNSYGSYRAMYYMQNASEMVKHIICVNPAFRMLNILETIKEFKYDELENDSKVSMKSSKGKFLSKSYLDDLYEFDVNSVKNRLNVPITLIIGDKDNLIPKKHIDEFLNGLNCNVIHVDDFHCLESEDSWNVVKDYIRSLL